MRGEVRTQVDAPPERLYAMVSDVTRMGEWSPETEAAEWVEGDGPAVGARFRGHNRRGPMRWSTTATVTVAEPGREFAFDTGSTRWRYRFVPSGSGTEVVESFETHAHRVSELLAKVFRRRAQLEAGMRATLLRLKEAAERA